jgi:DNA-binding NarL/FixJ family response regulator
MEVVMSETTRVIIVEDHDLMRSYLTKFIEQMDRCTVVAEAVEGRQALDLVRTIPADLMVLDLSLPGISGLSVMEETKKISPIKILVVTMHSDPDTIQGALDAGADGVVLKDAGTRMLEQAILETLAGKRPVYASAS